MVVNATVFIQLVIVHALFVDCLQEMNKIVEDVNKSRVGSPASGRRLNSVGLEHLNQHPPLHHHAHACHLDPFSLCSWKQSGKQRKAWPNEESVVLHVHASVRMRCFSSGEEHEGE